MNITITKAGKDYEFKHSVEDTGNKLNRNDSRTLKVHTWTCAELPLHGEVFFSDYDNTEKSLTAIKASAEKAIGKLPEVVAIKEVEEEGKLEETESKSE